MTTKEKTREALKCVGNMALGVEALDPNAIELGRTYLRFLADSKPHDLGLALRALQFGLRRELA